MTRSANLRQEAAGGFFLLDKQRRCGPSSTKWPYYYPDLFLEYGPVTSLLHHPSHLVVRATLRLVDDLSVRPRPMPASLSGAVRLTECVTLS
jgi:hypothetical protein